MKPERVDLPRPQDGVVHKSGICRRIIIFTDLDGTLLDESYSYRPADRALRIIRERGIPLVICSSKTRAEIEYYQKKMGVAGPFISENGGAVFIPQGYFSPETEGAVRYDGSDDIFRIIRLGAPYRDLRSVLTRLRVRGFNVRGFGDMSVPEISQLTKLPENEAELASLREFDEPFVFEGNADEAGKLEETVRSVGFQLGRADFFHIMGHRSDKGRAVSIVTGMYRREFGEVLTVALGDGANDLPMLREADIPVVVQRPDGSYYTGFEQDNFCKAEGVGPHGWNNAVVKILSSPVCRVL